MSQDLLLGPVWFKGVESGFTLVSEGLSCTLHEQSIVPFLLHVGQRRNSSKVKIPMDDLLFLDCEAWGVRTRPKNLVYHSEEVTKDS